jgi:hypothetical protein
MANAIRDSFLAELRKRFGGITKLPESNSLFDVGEGRARIYIRYSKVHNGRGTFYGLRKNDLRALEGQNSFIVFLWDEQNEPLFLPFDSYEEVFRAANPASDGQYKAQVLIDDDNTELYLPRLGRFNMEGLIGWDSLQRSVLTSRGSLIPDLSHCQVQSIVSAIGIAKGYDVWVPLNNRAGIDLKLAGAIKFREELPGPLREVNDVLQEVDVVWLGRGSNELRGMFEVEHSTAIYSALLRFNDVHLVAGGSPLTFRIIANGARRPQFVRQLNRPTFRASGLTQNCTFLDYRNVFGWFKRTCPSAVTGAPLE